VSDFLNNSGILFPECSYRITRTIALAGRAELSESQDSVFQRQNKMSRGLGPWLLTPASSLQEEQGLASLCTHPPSGFIAHTPCIGSAETELGNPPPDSQPSLPQECPFCDCCRHPLGRPLESGASLPVALMSTVGTEGRGSAT
jgi:hypothetical protein